MPSESNLKIAESFFRASIRAVAQDVINLVVPGSAIGVVLIEHAGVAFCKAAWGWLCPKKAAEQQQAIDGLAETRTERAREIAEAELKHPGLGNEAKSQLTSYLSAIPMTARRAISRWNDRGNPTTLLSQLPKSENDLQKFIPLRTPHFLEASPVPGHDYQLDFLVGQGGFAEVWKAHHLYREHMPPVALKFCLDRKLAASLKKEMKILDILSSPDHSEGFVQLVETAYSADPPFLVYEYVDGGDLASWLASFDGKPPSDKDVVSVLKMTAKALAFAHDNNIVHRDLKPSNLLVTRNGRVKVADFGIGSISAAELERKNTTSVSVFQGAHTRDYADRSMIGVADPKVDVYALGIIAYQLLAGNFSHGIIHAWDTDLRERNVPNHLIELIDACVTLPAKRLANAGQVLAALDSFPKQVEKNGTATIKQTAKPEVSNFCIHCGMRVFTIEDKFCNRCGRNPRG